ncbi:unnamed protein product [Phytomonas sp. EM1]|nr:unnamed protein product [Phytomonas sp. EM1]|eukprot:CCW64578.1 unnamed protein product [Phytomonas sp. isolate EM1]
MLMRLTKSSNIIQAIDNVEKGKVCKPGFFQRLQSTILNNIKIEINELSICLVSGTGISDAEKISVCLKVPSIKCEPTDSNHALFVSGEARGKIFRRVVIENTTLHINNGKPVDVCLSSDQHSLNELAFEDFARVCEDVSNYQTALSSKKATVTIVFNPETSDLQCFTTIVSVLIFIDQIFLIASLSLFKSLNQAKSAASVDKPVSRPMCANASAWWRYAIYSVVSEISASRKRKYFDWNKYVSWKKACTKYYNRMLVEYGAPWIVPEDIATDNSEPEETLSPDDLTELRKKARDAVQVFEARRIVPDLRLCHEASIRKPEASPQSPFLPSRLTFELPKIRIRTDDDFFLDAEVFSVTVHVGRKKISINASLQSAQLNSLETKLIPHESDLLIARSNKPTLKCDIHGFGESVETTVRMSSLSIFISESSLSTLHAMCEKYRQVSMMVSQKLREVRNTEANDGTQSILHSLTHKIAMTVNSIAITIGDATTSIEGVSLLSNPNSVNCSISSTLVSISGVNLFRGENISLTSQFMDFVFNIKIRAANIENNLVAFEHLKNTMSTLKQLYYKISQNRSEKVGEFHDSKIFVVVVEFTSIRFSALEFCNVSTSTAIRDGWKVSMDCKGVQCASACYPTAKVSLLIWANSMLSSSPYSGEINENGIAFHFRANDLHLQVDNVFAEVIESLYDVVNLLINPQEDAHVYLRDTCMFNIPNMSGSIFLDDCSMCLIDDENILLPIEICALARRSLVVKFNYYRDKRVDVQVDWNDGVNAFIKDLSPTVVDLLPHRSGGRCSVQFHLTPPQSQDMLLFPYARLHLNVETDNYDAVMHFPTIQALWLQFNSVRLPLWRLCNIGSRIHFTNRSSRMGLRPARSPTSQKYADLGHAAKMKSIYGCEVINPSPFHLEGLFPMEIKMNMKFTQSGLYYLWGSGEIASMYFYISSCEAHLSNRDGCLRAELSGQLSFPQLRFISPTPLASPTSPDVSTHVGTSKIHSRYVSFGCSYAKNPLLLKLVYTNDSRPPFNDGVANESLNISITGCTFRKPSTGTSPFQNQHEPILARFDREEVAAWLTVLSYNNAAKTAIQSIRDNFPVLPSFAPPTKFVSEEVNCNAAKKNRRILTTVQFAPALLHFPTTGLAVLLSGGLRLSNTSVLNEMCIPSVSLLYSEFFFHQIDRSLLESIIWSTPRPYGPHSRKKDRDIHLLARIESFSRDVKDVLDTHITQQMSAIAVYWATSQNPIKPHDDKKDRTIEIQGDGLNPWFASQRLLVGQLTSNIDESLLASFIGSTARITNGFYQIKQTMLRYNNNISLAECARINLYINYYGRDRNLLAFPDGEGLCQPQEYHDAVNNVDAVESRPLAKTLQDSVLSPPTFYLFLEAIHIEYNWRTQLLTPPASTVSIVFRCGPLQYCNKHREATTGNADNMCQLDETLVCDTCQPPRGSLAIIAFDHVHVFFKLDLIEIPVDIDANETNGSLKAFSKTFPLVFPFDITTIQTRKVSFVSLLDTQEEPFGIPTTFPNNHVSTDANSSSCLTAKAAAPLALEVSPLFILLLPTSYMLLYELVQSLTVMFSVVPTKPHLPPAVERNAAPLHAEMRKADNKQSVMSLRSDVEHSLGERPKEHSSLCFVISSHLLELRIIKFCTEEDEWVFLQSLGVAQGTPEAALSPTQAVSSTAVISQEDEEKPLGQSKVTEGLHHSIELVHKEALNFEDKNSDAAQSPSVVVPTRSFPMLSKASDNANVCFRKIGNFFVINIELEREQKQQVLSQWTRVCVAHAVFACDCFVLSMNHTCFTSNIAHKWSATIAHAACSHYVHDHPDYPQKWQRQAARTHSHVSLVCIDGLACRGSVASPEAEHHGVEKKHQCHEEVGEDGPDLHCSRTGDAFEAFSIEKKDFRCEVESIGVEVDIPSVITLTEFLIVSPLKRINFLNQKVSQDGAKGGDMGIAATVSPQWIHIAPITGDKWSLTEDVHLSHRRHSKVLYFRSLNSNHLTVHMNGHTIFIEPDHGHTGSTLRGNGCPEDKGSKSSANAPHRGFQLDQALMIVEAGLTVRFVGAGGFRIPIHHWSQGLATKVERMGVVAALLPYTTLGEASWVECEEGLHLGFTEAYFSMNTSRDDPTTAYVESSPSSVAQLPRNYGKVEGEQHIRQRQGRLQSFDAFSSSLSVELGDQASPSGEENVWSMPMKEYKTDLEAACDALNSLFILPPLEEEDKRVVSSDDEVKELAKQVSPCVAAYSSADGTSNLSENVFTTTFTQGHGVLERSLQNSLTGIIRRLTVCWRSSVEPRFLHLNTSLHLQTCLIDGQWSEGQLQLQQLAMHSQLEGVYSSTTSAMILAPTSVDVRLNKGFHHAASLGPLSVDITKNDVDLFRSLIHETQSAIEYFSYLRLTQEEKEILQLIEATIVSRPVHTYHIHSDVLKGEAEETTNGCSNTPEAPRQTRAPSRTDTSPCSTSFIQHEGTAKGGKTRNTREGLHEDDIGLTSFALYIPLVTVTLSDHRFPLLRATVRDIALRHTTNAASDRAIFLQSQAFEVDVFGKGLWDSVLLPTAELTVEYIQSKSRYSSNTRLLVTCDGLQVQCSYRVLSSLFYATNQASTFFRQQKRVVPPVPINFNVHRRYSSTAITNETARDNSDTDSWWISAAKTHQLHSEKSVARSPAVVRDVYSFPSSSPLNLIEAGSASTPLSSALPSMSREALNTEAILCGDSTTVGLPLAEETRSEKSTRDVGEVRDSFVPSKAHPIRSAVLIEGTATHRFKNSFNCTFYLRIGCKSGGADADWLCVPPSSSVDILIPYKRVHELFVCVFPQDYVVWSVSSGSYVLTTKAKNSVLSKAEVAVSALRYGRATGLLVGEDMLVVLSCVDPRRLGASASREAGVSPDGPSPEVVPMGVTCEASRWAGLQQSALPSPQVEGNSSEAAPIPTSDEEGDVAGLIVVQIHAKLTLCNQSGVPLLVSQHLVGERVEETGMIYRNMQGGRNEVGGSGDQQVRGIDNTAEYELLPTGYCYPLKSNCFTLRLRCNTNRTFNSVYAAEIDVLTLKSGMLLRLYPFPETTDSSICNKDDKQRKIPRGSCGVAQMIRQDAFNDTRPLMFLVACREITESQSRVITLLPCFRVVNHTGITLKISIWQKDGFAGAQTPMDCALMEPWLPRESDRKWCVPEKKKHFFYSSLVPLAIHDELRHNHALSILQYTVDSNLALGLSFAQCTGAMVRTEGLVPIVKNLRRALHHNSLWLPLHDSIGRTFHVHVAIFQRVIVLSAAVWVYNLTYYPLLLTDSSLTCRLTAGQDSNTGIIPSQGTPFLIGCKLQDFPYMSFKIGLDGEWSSLVPMDVGTSGVFESIQKEFRITRSCNYSIQFPNLQMARPVVLCITSRWVFINRTMKSLRLFFDYPGMQGVIEKTYEEARKAASQTAGDTTRSRGITMALASVVSIELNPGEYHVSCIGTDTGNKLTLQEKVEAIPSSLTTTTTAITAGDKDTPMLYESLRTDNVPIDQPGQATLNLWVVPRPLVASLPPHSCATAEGSFGGPDTDAVVTGRIIVSVQNAEGMLAVVLSSCSDQHVLIQNRTQGTTVIVTQKGRQRRSIIPVRQDRFFFWEDSSGEHVMGVRAQGNNISWFEIDFTHGNCLITPRQSDSTLKGNEQSPRAREREKYGRRKCPPQSPSSEAARTPPFHVRGYVSTEKKRVTVIITDAPIPRYVTIDPWRTSFFFGLRVPFMQARWLCDAIQAEGVAHDIQRPAALVSCAVESLSLDWLDTEDSSNGFATMHQLQLIDEVRQAVFLYRARVKPPPLLRRSTESSPYSSVGDEGLETSPTLQVPISRCASVTLPRQLLHRASSTFGPSSSALESPHAVHVSIPSSHELNRFHRTDSCLREEYQASNTSETTLTLSLFEARRSGSLALFPQTHRSPDTSTRGAAHAGRKRRLNDNRGVQGLSNAVGKNVSAPGWVSGSVFSLMGYKTGDWAHETMELEWDLKLELSVVKYPDGMRRVTELHGSITALVLVISDLWLAHFLREVGMLRTLLAQVRRCRVKQLSTYHRGGFESVTSSGTEDALLEGADRYTSRSAWLHDGRNEDDMVRPSGTPSSVAATLQPSHMFIPNSRHSNQFSNYNEVRRELMDMRGSSGARLSSPHKAIRMESSVPEQLASQPVLHLPQRDVPAAPSTELVPQAMFVVRLVRAILAQQPSTETSADNDTYPGGKGRQAGVTPHGRGTKLRSPADTSSFGLFYVEKMHFSRVTFFITFTRQDPDPLWPLIGAYALMLPTDLRQCEFYFKPFTLEHYMGTVSSIEAILRKWCVRSLLRQWTKVTKLGTVLNMLQWWRTRWVLRGPPIRLNLALVRRLQCTMGKNTKRGTAQHAANAHHSFVVPFMSSEEEDAEENNLLEKSAAMDSESRR